MPRKNKKGGGQQQRRSQLMRELEKMKGIKEKKKSQSGSTPAHSAKSPSGQKQSPRSAAKKGPHGHTRFGSKSSSQKQEGDSSRRFGRNESSGRVPAHQNQRSFNSPNKAPQSNGGPSKLPAKIPPLVEGRLDIHPNGFAFVVPTDPEIPHVYIPQSDFREYMNRDIVQAKILRSFQDGKVSGSLVTIIKRHQHELIGTVRLFAGGRWVIPFDPRDRHLTFEIANTPSFEIKNNQTVLCKILEFPTKSRGKVDIVQSIDDVEKPHNDTLRILLQSAWPREFSQKALSEAETLAQNWEKDFGKELVDLTHIPFVTIDGIDARDFDDAVYARENAGGFELWVAIADVSRFVKLGTRLDEEAFARSTSVYFPDHVVPMLPEVLSNGSCSLKPDELRPSLCCHMHVDSRGEITQYEFAEGIIRSRRRMTYEEFEEWYEKRSTLTYTPELLSSFETLVKLTEKFLARRRKQGGLDLDIPEARVFLNKDGSVRDIQLRGRLYSHKLIEESMLAANRATATFIREKGIGLYRIHEKPNPRKVQDLLGFLTLVGVPAPAQLENTPDFAQLLDILKQESSGLTEAMVRAVHSQILRSLAQAKYSHEPLGHFALNEANYTHFTSPIRRYPDLIVHRIVRSHLEKLKDIPHADDIATMARHTSDCERQAVDMERKLIDIKKCRYVESHVGEVYKCFVTGVTEKGLFCQIQDHFVDGLLEGEILGNHKFFFDGSLSYRGPHHREITFGSELLLRIDRVDVIQGRINFGWGEENNEKDFEKAPAERGRRAK